jgi:hypothetical protein
MPVKIEITGENAGQAVGELRALAQHLGGGSTGSFEKAVESFDTLLAPGASIRSEDKPAAPRTRTKKEPASAVVEVEPVLGAPVAETTPPFSVEMVPAATPAEPVSYDAVKAVLSQVIDQKNASSAQAAMRDAAGVGSLSAAKPEQYGVIKAALEKVLAA